MKNFLPIGLLMAGLFLLNNITNAQLSQGGKPYSFNKHFTPANAIKFQKMPAFDLATLQAEDAVNDLSKGPFRFGYNHYVNLSLNNSGVWTLLPNGDRLWQLGIKVN